MLNNSRNVVGALSRSYSLSIFLQIIFSHESLGDTGKREGRIKRFARVDDSVEMDARSVAESFCRILAKSHLFPGALVGAHAFIGENVMLNEYCVIQSHAIVYNDTQRSENGLL